MDDPELLCFAAAYPDNPLFDDIRKLLRSVSLPLPKLEKCAICGKTDELRLCSSCGEKTYCSPTCQRKDWPNHKAHCGKTDKIDLGIFYPFLATVIDSVRTDHRIPKKPFHEGTRRQILNSPNPGAELIKLPDGTEAKLIVLGEKIDDDWTFEKWWPTAESHRIRYKLLGRMLRDGHVLSLVMTICFSILARIYTTNWVPASKSKDGREQRRVRLWYRNSPISDFGIVKGEYRNIPDGRFIFRDAKGKPIQSSQNPKEHYWIYFENLRGETATLDCCAYTFDYTECVETEKYKLGDLFSHDAAPVLFTRGTSDYHITKAKFSVLRNEKMQRAVALSTKMDDYWNMEQIWQFMDHVAGKESLSVEYHLSHMYILRSLAAFTYALEHQSWLEWPRDAPRQWDMDKKSEWSWPEKSQEVIDRLKERYNKGSITIDQLQIGILREAKRCGKQKA